MGMPPLQQAKREIPRFVPVLHHGAGRALPFRADIVAIPLAVACGLAKRFGSHAGDIVRHRFGVHEDTELMILGIGKDRGIESYWRDHRKLDLPALLAQMGFRFGITPNYSYLLNEPRTQHLHNRKRIVKVAASWSQAGISPIPVLQAVSAHDWSIWGEYLGEHTEIRSVAVELQTGGRMLDRALGVVEQLARLQDQTGRALHPLLVGGTHVVSQLTQKFESWTVVNSMPLQQAIHRMRLGFGNGKLRAEKDLNADRDELLLHNDIMYRRYIDAKARHD